MLGQRRNRDIGKTGVTSLRHGPIRHLSRQSCGLRIQRQNPVRIARQQTIQPAVKPICPFDPTSAAQLANALRHFSNSNGRQKK